MKIDTNQKVIILAPSFSVGNNMIKTLRSWDAITEKPEVIIEAYKMRTIRNSIIVANIASFGYTGNWKVWSNMKASLEGYRAKYLILEDNTSEKQFIQHFNEIYENANQVQQIN